MTNFQQAEFVASYGTKGQLPDSSFPEVSFVGRSNVGKSSLMNKLFGRKSLVKVSSTPGKTANINFFVAGDAHFVDLPGYGYAKIAQAQRQRWSGLIEGYFAQERRFALAVQLIDLRHDLSTLDADMVSYLENRGLPYLVAFTKADKLSRSQQARHIADLCSQLASCGADPVVVSTSAKTGQGVDDLRALIADALSQERASRGTVTTKG